MQNNGTGQPAAGWVAYSANQPRTITFTPKALGEEVTRSPIPTSSRFAGVGVGREATSLYITLMRQPC